MLMVPNLLPVPVPTMGAVVGVAGALPAPAGAALPVWARAEIITPKSGEKTAMARKERRNLLVIGSLNSLEHCSGKYGSGEYGPGMNSDYPFQATLGRTAAS